MTEDQIPNRKLAWIAFWTPLSVFAPKYREDHYAASHSDAIKETDDQKRQMASGADGRKGVVAGKISNDPGIRHIIKLLEQLPRNRGGIANRISPPVIEPFVRSLFMLFVPSPHHFFISARAAPAGSSPEKI